MMTCKLPIATPKLRIGLLGGSFNPAHDGHLHISTQALSRLDLDWVWWLVSPQNPLKSTAQTRPLEERIKHAQDFVHHPRIVVSDLEARMGTQYSLDTVRRLKARWPDTQFVWLMGADVFTQLPQWKHWVQFMNLVPISVYDRPGYGLKALTATAAQRFAQNRLDMSDGAQLASAQTPAWCFSHTPLHHASSTELRMKSRNKV